MSNSTAFKPSGQDLRPPGYTAEISAGRPLGFEQHLALWKAMAFAAIRHDPGAGAALVVGFDLAEGADDAGMVA